MPATDPSVIFTDEPTGALNQATDGEVMSLLTSACVSTGTPFVLTTHDPTVTARPPHMIHVRGGRISLEARGSGASNQGVARWTRYAPPRGRSYGHMTG